MVSIVNFDGIRKMPNIHLTGMINQLLWCRLHKHVVLSCRVCHHMLPPARWIHMLFSTRVSTAGKIADGGSQCPGIAATPSHAEFPARGSRPYRHIRKMRRNVRPDTQESSSGVALSSTGSVDSCGSDSGLTDGSDGSCDIYYNSPYHSMKRKSQAPRAYQMLWEQPVGEMYTWHTPGGIRPRAAGCWGFTQVPCWGSIPLGDNPCKLSVSVETDVKIHCMRCMKARTISRLQGQCLGLWWEAVAAHSIWGSANASVLHTRTS